MPRKPRMYLPGVPCRVVQRGNNREATFFADQDYQFYPHCLEDATSIKRTDLYSITRLTNK